MGTFIVLVVLVLIVALIIRGMIRDKKAGKSILCGGDCKYCGGHCHQTGIHQTGIYQSGTQQTGGTKNG